MGGILMSNYVALYRAYRPNSFNDLVGQDHIKTTIMNAIKLEKVAHAYLLSGPRGTGKTTVAKIIGKGVNCLAPLSNGEPCQKCANCSDINNNKFTDILEFDAASNNGVEEIRQIRDQVHLAPVTGKYKVYIIDEVHMLSNSAFNALLKTLEEPPAHVIFILATTDPQKVPKTIISRCQQFEFRNIPLQAMIDRLKFISHDQGIRITDEALHLISQLAEGGLRNALSIMDQVIAYATNNVTIEHVATVVGKVAIQDIEKLIHYITEKDLTSTLDSLQTILERKQADFFLSDLIGYYRDLMIFNLSQKTDMFKVAIYNNAFINLAERIPLSKIPSILEELTTVQYKIKSSVYAATLIEIALVKILQLEQEISMNQPNIQNNENEASSELNQTLLQSLLDTIATFNQRLDEYEKQKEQPISNQRRRNIQVYRDPKAKETAKDIVLPEITWETSKLLETFLPNCIAHIKKDNPLIANSLGEIVHATGSKHHIIFVMENPQQVETLYNPLNDSIVTKTISQLLRRQIKMIYLEKSEWEEINTNKEV
ncbi:DNA polymerase III subunit gamma/tau [Bacillus sp. AFS054943]|nr:DNA polymerase III subunit gamma/tau [Bacillus sp. AFS054943]